MSNHTPGPWRAMHAGTANDEHARVIRSDGGAWIADVLKQGTEADRAANARLIAAAPDVLAALEDAEGWLNDSDVAYVISHDKGEQAAYCRMMVNIRAAIRKARGQ